MRILVCSDSHGRSDTLLSAIRAEGNFSLLIHLGDGAADVPLAQRLLDGKPVIQLRGNCDLGEPDLPEQILTQEGGKTLLCTHGHRHFVKFGEERLENAAREAHADIALYGHTHVPVQHYRDGLYICNPGTLMYGQYAVLEIVPQGILWLPKKLSPHLF